MDEADSLAALRPTDRRYITQTNDADQTSVIFGNGEHGALTPTGSVNIKAAGEAVKKEPLGERVHDQTPMQVKIHASAVSRGASL
jgi:hypothetical protein